MKMSVGLPTLQPLAPQPANTPAGCYGKQLRELDRTARKLLPLPDIVGQSLSIEEITLICPHICGFYYICNMKKEDTKAIVKGYDCPTSEISLSDVGAAITRSRKSIGMTQTELGKSLGLGKTQISKIENSDNMTISTLAKLYGAMHYDVKISLEPVIDQSVEDELTEDVVLCVSEYARKHNLPIHSAYAYLKRFGAIDFYFRFYDTHSGESIDEILDTFDAITRRNGGEI